MYSRLYIIYFHIVDISCPSTDIMIYEYVHDEWKCSDAFPGHYSSAENEIFCIPPHNPIIEWSPLSFHSLSFAALYSSRASISAVPVRARCRKVDSLNRICPYIAQTGCTEQNNLKLNTGSKAPSIVTDKKDTDVKLTLCNGERFVKSATCC